MQPANENRQRDPSGEISAKHGGTAIGVLRAVYGPDFAKGERDDATLSGVLHRLNRESLSQLVRLHRSGELEGRIRRASSF